MCPVLKNDYPVELSPPDISRYRRGNTGIEYVTTLDSSVAGPHAMITALVHGNELCGAIILDYLFREGVKPTRGKLTLAFVNIDAFSRFDPKNPIASRLVDEDFNRLWSKDVLDGPRDSVELRRARTLRPIVDQVDLLLDIHSMQHAAAPLAMCGPLAKGRALARGVGLPEIGVVDSGHAAGKRMRDYASFGDERSPKNALLVECGQHWEKSSVDVARESAIRFLLHAKVVDPGWAKTRISAAPLPKQRFIEVTAPVTIATDDFRFAADYRGLEVIPKAGTVIGHDGAKPVATPYDDCVLVMPSRRLLKGQSAVRFGRYA